MRRLVRRVERGPFEAAIAFAAVVAALAFIADPSAAQHAAVGRVSRELLPYWVALYGIGGCVTLIGMLGLSLRTEVVGLLILAGAIVVNAVSISHYFGAQGVSSAATFLALTLACLARARFLWRAFHRARDDR